MQIAHAGFIDFLQMLFSIFLVLIGIGYFVSLLFPLVLKLIAKRLMRKFQNSMNVPPGQENSMANSSSRAKKIVGEYIDFEEIK